MWLVALEIVLIGGSIGLPQWLLLRQRVRRAAWWILASVLGWGVAVLVARRDHFEHAGCASGRVFAACRWQHCLVVATRQVAATR